MQEFMQTYKDHVEDIENFLMETITNTGDLASKEKNNFEGLYKLFPSLELIYICDKESCDQTSSNIYRTNTTQTQIGRNRKYLLSKLHLSEKNISVSAPYISSATGNTCITIAKEEEDKPLNNIFFAAMYSLNVL